MFDFKLLLFFYFYIKQETDHQMDKQAADKKNNQQVILYTSVRLLPRVGHSYVDPQLKAQMERAKANVPYPNEWKQAEQFKEVKCFQRKFSCNVDDLSQ